MATCRHVYLFLLMSVLITRRVKSNNASGYVCMTKAVAFIENTKFPSSHSFQAKEAYELILSDNNVCHSSCKMDIIGIKDQPTEYMYINSLTLTFNNYNYTFSKHYKNYADFYFDCSSWDKEQLGIFWNSHCKEENAYCFKLDTFCVCRCNSGYLMIKGQCLREESTDYNMGPVIHVGALFGGLLLGVTITSGIAYLMHRRSRYSIGERKEPGVRHVAKDTSYDVRYGDSVQRKPSVKNIKDEQKRVLNVCPPTQSKESPDTAMDDVYNHLNEKEETQDEDTYDHACAVAASGHRDLDDYSNINGMDDDVVSGRTNNDDYSNLEHN